MESKVKDFHKTEERILIRIKKRSHLFLREEFSTIRI